MNALLKILDEAMPSGASQASPTPDQLEALLAELAIEREHADAIANHAPSDDVLLTAVQTLSTTKLFKALLNFDNAALSQRLKEKPELFFQLIHSQCALSRTSLEHARFNWKKQETERRRQQRERKLKEQKPILITSDTIQAIARALTPVPPRPEPTPAPMVTEAPAPGRNATPTGTAPNTSSHDKLPDAQALDTLSRSLATKAANLQPAIPSLSFDPNGPPRATGHHRPVEPQEELLIASL